MADCGCKPERVPAPDRRSLNQAEPSQRKTGLTAAVLELQAARAAAPRAGGEMNADRRVIQDGNRQWHAAFDEEIDFILLYDKSYRIVRANRAYAERAGMTLETMIGKPYWEVFPRRRGPLPERQAGAASGDRGVELRLDSGEALFSRSTPLHGEAGEYLSTLHVLRDITAQRRAEVAYARSRLVLKMLGECLLEMAQAADERQMIQTACDALVRKYGYHLAWVGYAAQETSQAAGTAVHPVVHRGHRSGHLDAQTAAGEDGAGGEHNPAALAMSACAPFVAQNILKASQFAFLRKDAVRSGYASALGLPLRDKGSVLGALCIYAADAFAFEPEEVRLLECLAAGVAQGVVAFRVRTERNAALEQRAERLDRLSSGLEDTIEAIANALEMRDARNVRHQSRVGALAMAIATEMGLPAEQARGIRLAGLVHDVGESRISREIFNKSARLTEDEVMLEQEHARFGHDVLQNIDLPWPIAEIVLQHHERLDGSGYPRGLKRNEILLEARIIGVADTIVAMAFEQHAYRPRLGIPAALAEVERQKGCCYDAAVVDAALRLFHNKRFSISGS